MANMTIENIGRFINTGDLERVMDRGQNIQGPVSPGVESAAEGKGFVQMLNESIEKANEVQLQADRGVKELAAGRNKNIHETMLLLEKADMNFRMITQVRNKIIDAYREIMRMQV